MGASWPNEIWRSVMEEMREGNKSSHQIVG
jgi:hypothetical protein